jgi:hypothetical protein
MNRKKKNVHPSEEGVGISHIEALVVLAIIFPPNKPGDQIKTVFIVRNLGDLWVLRPPRCAAPRFCSDGGTGVEIDDDGMAIVVQHNVARVDIVVNKSKTMEPV